MNAKAWRRWLFKQAKVFESGLEATLFIVPHKVFSLKEPDGAVEAIWQRWNEAGRPAFLRYGRGVILATKR